MSKMFKYFSMLLIAVMLIGLGACQTAPTADYRAGGAGGRNNLRPPVPPAAVQPAATAEPQPLRPPHKRRDQESLQGLAL